MARKRATRTPTGGVPATFAAAQDEIIQSTVNGWRAHIDDAKINSEASCRLIEASLFHQLELHEQGCTRLEPREIVDMALAGHGPADAAIRRFAGPRIGDERVHRLPAAVRDYASRAVYSPPLSVAYSSRAPQVVNNFMRDMLIPGMVDMVVTRWPEVPRLYSTPRHRSAASYVGMAWGLKERQTAHICENRPVLSEQLATFMVGFIRAT